MYSDLLLLMALEIRTTETKDRLGLVRIWSCVWLRYLWACHECAARACFTWSKPTGLTWSLYVVYFACYLSKNAVRSAVAEQYWRCKMKLVQWYRGVVCKRNCTWATQMVLDYFSHFFAEKGKHHICRFQQVPAWTNLNTLKAHCLWPIWQYVKYFYMISDYV